ncbi:50S ribosomal protein 5, chloroplastic [Abrus precatorius]|uniref:50S ribosomal protein 5, chloroplastic n=1 Tax=Abrus precatorius TaxID=3816 RepID=A0A8B8L8B4_ABRPR|nr:50S ribosomal protein 5, chloroplastic [Abrus precatorius]
MALLSFNSITLPPSSSIFALPTSSASRLYLAVPLKPFNGLRITTPFFVKRKKKAAFVGAASDDSGGAGSPEVGGSEPIPPAESEKEGGGSVPVEKLPLESKLKEREEQRLRMKLAKKIRLRRKRLLRKRRLRKKGRWPPSKMKKLKNV